MTSSIDKSCFFASNTTTKALETEYGLVSCKIDYTFDSGKSYLLNNVVRNCTHHSLKIIARNHLLTGSTIQQQQKYHSIQKDRQKLKKQTKLSKLCYFLVCQNQKRYRGRGREQE